MIVSHQSWLRTLIAFVSCFPLTALHGEATDIAGTLAGTTHLQRLDNPYRVTGDVTVPADGELVIEPGVHVLFRDDTRIVIHGRFSAMGTPMEPIQLQPETVGGRWRAVILEQSIQGGIMRHVAVDGGSSAGDYRTGMISIYQCPGGVLIEDCTFSNWPEGLGHKAIDAYASPNVTIRRCRFLEGPNEAVFGIFSPMIIENCIFHPRTGYSDAIDLSMNEVPDPVPVVRNNVFLGSDDDAVDLDTCDAIVDSNLVMNCRGGSHDPIGISGDKNSKPTIINNVVINCENGIGFKNGADILVVNNTIINCDRGIWLHQEPAHATVINTIIWGRSNQESIVLEPGSTIDVRYSLVAGEDNYPGERNLNENPLFLDVENNDYRLSSRSPCIDNGTYGNAPDHDFDGNTRPEGIAIDIGAFEYVTPSSGVFGWVFH